MTTSHGMTSSNKVFLDDTSDDFEEPSTAQTIAKSSITHKEATKKSSLKKQSKLARIPRKKSPLKANKPVASTAKSIFHKKLPEDKAVTNNSDNDFAPEKKVKVVNNLLTAFKSKHKFIYDKAPKESTQSEGKEVNKVTENVNTVKGKSRVVKKISTEAESANKFDHSVITIDLDSNKELQLPKENVKSTSLNKQTEAISSGGDINSQLVIELNDTEDVSPKISLKNDRIFDNTPEKTYLQCDEILADITATTNLPKSRNVLDALYTNIPFKKSERQKSPPHSTPSEVFKKRKLAVDADSPDVIPSTPQEQVTDKSVNRKGKSKMCIENKFSKLTHPLLVGKYNTDDYVVPDMVVKSPPAKKIRPKEYGKVLNLKDINAHEFDEILKLSLAKPSSSVKEADSIQLVPEKCGVKKCEISAQKCHNVLKDQKHTVPNVLNSDDDDFVKRKPPNTPPKSSKSHNNVAKSTSNFIVSPSKNMSPSKRSPHKGTVLKMPVSPVKSGLNTKRSLFNCVTENDVQEINNENNPVLTSENGDKEVRKNRKQSPSKLKTKTGNDLLDYFTNLPSSNEEKKCIELDRSNFILTRKSVSVKETVQENIDDFDDLNFDDDWDEELNNIEVIYSYFLYHKILEYT